MHIYDLQNIQMNRGLAYTLGLIYPLYKEKKLNSRKYILGCVNHNPGMITRDELNTHFRDVNNMFETFMGNDAPVLKSNKTAEYSISPKEGFSVLVDITNVGEDECMSILTKKVIEIKTAECEIKQEFIKGCFDGRSSWDTSRHYLSLDVDRVYEKQDLIAEIAESVGIGLNLNRRESNHNKNDQIRIKPDSLQTFMSKIGFYSVCRRRLVEIGLKHCGR